MKKPLPGIVMSLLIFVGTAMPCTVTIIGLRKEFRNSRQVFIGEFVSFVDESKSLPAPLAEKWKALASVKFKIEKSWKGPESGETELYLNPICDCPMRELLPKTGERFLIHADKDGVIDACDMYVIEMAHDRRRDELKRIINQLDSFWFRIWARIYPF